MKLAQLIDCEKRLADLKIKGITNDSRKVKKDYLFINTHNNPIYNDDAVNNGALAVVSSYDFGFDNQIIVDNPIKAFGQISAKWFGNPADDLILLGVTGTNGKTSVTYMLKAILEKAGHKVGLIGTIQNLIGDEIIPSINTTPNAYYLNELFAIMKEKGCKYVIMEVSSHGLAQENVLGLNFKVAMFTNLTQDHLDFHKNMENYYLAKKQLFKMCETAVINVDDDYGRRLLRDTDCEKLTYSLENDSNYIAKGIKYNPTGVDYELLAESLSHIKVNTAGKFTVYNSLCAIACALKIGIPLNTVADALKELKGVKGRAEVVPNTKDFTVIIDYAHTPDGLKNILRTFKECNKNRLIVLFGCGGDRDKTKRSIMGDIASHYADFVIVTSDNPRTEDKSEIIKDILKGIQNNQSSYKVIEERQDAIKFALSIAKKDDIIVLAGKGHETYQILGKSKVHFDEREIIRQALSKQ